MVKSDCVKSTFIFWTSGLKQHPEKWSWLKHGIPGQRISDNGQSISFSISLWAAPQETGFPCSNRGDPEGSWRGLLGKIQLISEYIDVDTRLDCGNAHVCATCWLQPHITQIALRELPLYIYGTEYSFLSKSVILLEIGDTRPNIHFSVNYVKAKAYLIFVNLLHGHII